MQLHTMTMMMLEQCLLFSFSYADVFRQNKYTNKDNRTNLVHNHRWVDSHSVHLRDTQKKRMGFMLLFEDITTPPENLP